jgi:hypothetical protein
VLTKELTGHGRVVVDLDGFSVGRASCVTISRDADPVWWLAGRETPAVPA